jgi:hypothetical protein
VIDFIKHILDRRGLVLSLFGVSWGLYGCGTNHNSASSNKIQIVQAGVGLPSCYLGMPIKDLQGDWRPPRHSTDADSDKTYLDNVKDGVGVKHDGKKVDGVFIYFSSDEYRQFTGQIEGGIAADSSIENVIRTKGQPANISITKEDDGEHTQLWYIEKGIVFDFLNKHLYEVTIAQPNSNYPPMLKEDIGDTAVYRKIQATSIR